MMLRLRSAQALFSFVFGVFVEADYVYHFSESASDSVAVMVFDFFGVEVGGYVGYPSPEASGRSGTVFGMWVF